MLDKLFGIDYGSLVVEKIDVILDYIARQQNWNKESFSITLQSKNNEIYMIIVKDGQARGKITKEQLNKILK